MNLNGWNIKFTNPTHNLFKVSKVWHADEIVPLPLPELFMNGCSGEQFFIFLFCVRSSYSNKMAERALNATSF